VKKMRRRESVVYELSKEEYDIISVCLLNIRKYFDADGTESSDAAEDSLTGIELIFDDVE